MGEYAIYKGQEIKIGTCEDMYYLRMQDADKVEQLPGSLDPADSTIKLRFRLPVPEEDNVEPGGYESMWAQVKLYGFRPEWDDEPESGISQVRDGMGYLINIKCHHGLKTPDLGPDGRAFVNGGLKPWLLCCIGRDPKRGAYPIVQCPGCGMMWGESWEDVLPYIMDSELQKRLMHIASE